MHLTVSLFHILIIYYHDIFPFTDRFAHFIYNQSFIIIIHVETAILLFNNNHCDFSLACLLSLLSGSITS